MSLTKEVKTAIIKSSAIKPEDTGSPEVQISVLTARIQYLTEHMKAHKKDFHSRRGLLMLVSRRKKLVTYLKDKDNSRYTAILEKLNLRGVK
ncbi:30S ribosomal protein S15 [Candidatus Hepatincolaceae symbiont of Richtersius coronifer]